MRKIDHEKIIDLMLYIANRNDTEIGFKKLLKLIYLSDRLHLRRYGRTISTDFYSAMKAGPVASETYDKCKQIAGTKINFGENSNLSSFFERGSKYYMIKPIKKPNLEKFSKSEIDIINEILKEFGDKTGDQLSNITHEYFEWKKYETLLEKTKTSFLIDFKDFFEEEENGTIFKMTSMQLNAIKELFLEDNELQIY